MMKEAYVSYEIAKLLKEKGFNWRVFNFYDEHERFSEHIGSVYTLCNWNCQAEDGHFSQYCSAPTQQMACSWLRKRGIHIMPTIGCDVDRTPRIFYGVVIALFNDYGDIDLRDPLNEKGYDSPEEAIEAALEYVLKNLI